MIKLKELLTEAFNEVPDISKKDHKKLKNFFLLQLKLNQVEQMYLDQ